MARTMLSFALSVFTAITFAQTGVKGVDATQVEVTAVAVDSSNIKVLGASAVGDFDVAPAHPDCVDRAGKDRLDCTASLVLGLICARNGEPRLDLDQWGGTMVSIALSVNQFGDVKDIRVDQVGDPDLARNVNMALHALPTLKPAMKEGSRAASTLMFNFSYEVLFVHP